MITFFLPCDSSTRCCSHSHQPLEMRGRRSTRSSRPARFFPDSGISQQLIPLFELLSVGDICALACSNSGWSAALDAWRSTEVDIGEALASDGLGHTVDSVRTIARKYPRLRSLFVPDQIDLDAATLNLLANCTMLRSIDCGQVDGPALVTLAQAAQQLRVVRVGTGLTAPSLVALAQACPNLEELTTIMYDYGHAPVRDADVAALATACPALRRLELKGSGYEISDDAAIDLVNRCQHLVHLHFGVAISDAIRGQLYAIRPALYIEDIYLNIKVVSQDGFEIFFKSKMHTRLRLLMNAFCQRAGVSIEAVQFFFDGEQIDETETPDDLDMEDGDVIDVYVSQW